MLSCWVFFCLSHSRRLGLQTSKSLWEFVCFASFLLQTESLSRSFRQKSCIEKPGSSASRPRRLRQPRRVSRGDPDRLTVRRELKRELLGVFIEASEDGLLELPQLVGPLLPQPVELLAFGDEHLLLLPGNAHFDLEAADQIKLSSAAVLSGNLESNNARINDSVQGLYQYH